jgi:hypothetical protein
MSTDPQIEKALEQGHAMLEKQEKPSQSMGNHVDNGRPPHYYMQGKEKTEQKALAAQLREKGEQDERATVSPRGVVAQSSEAEEDFLDTTYHVGELIASATAGGASTWSCCGDPEGFPGCRMKG